MMPAVVRVLTAASRCVLLRSAPVGLLFTSSLLSATLPAATGRGPHPAAPVKPDKVAATDVRFWSLGDTTRIAIQMTGDFKFETAKLANPPRIYYDLLDCRLQVNDDKINVFTV